MKKLILLALPLLFCAVIAKAQQITGNVKDDQGKSLSGATVALKKVKDSALVKLAATNTSGQYAFTGINAGSYFVAVSYTGHVAKSSAAFDVSGTGDVTAPEVVLVKATGQLKEVVVAARKPMVEVKADKTILNVEGSINSVGQDALDLLRKAPGVVVDKDDNLTLAGKNGVQVYIDGRPTPLSGKDLSDYLRTLQSSSIEAIEIITNPSAKYDAAGNAGIINIRLKKNKSYGTNGSINAGFNQGITPKYNGGFSLNHRNKHVNLFGNYSYNDNTNENNINLRREVLDTLFEQKSKLNIDNRSHNFKAGADYFLNRRSTIGIMANGSFSDMDMNNYSRTDISYIPNKQLDRVLIADNTNANKKNNINANLNYRYADSTGHELNVDADYGAYRNKSDQYQPNEYRDPDNNYLYSRIYHMYAPTDIDIYSVKADYEQNFKKGRLGLGGKISFVESNNDFNRYDVDPASGIKNLDVFRSNDFVYKENVNAGYVNYNRQFKGFMIQAGLRVENTHATGRSRGIKDDNGTLVDYDSTFTRDYTNLFPSAAITLNKKPMSQWSFTYSRRIDRPNYQNLNPFEFKLDEYTFQKGNTGLQPQYTNSFGVTHTYKYRLNTTLNYSHVKDIFAQLVDVTEKSKSFITQKNLANQDIVSLNISYPFQYKWYSIFGNLNAYYSHYKADLGVDRKVDLEVYAFTFFAQQSFRLGKGWTGEMSGWYSSPSIWQGTIKSSKIWSVDGGIQKTILKGNGSIKASVSDIFRTFKWRGTSNFAGQSTLASGNFESRQLKLNFTYRFGNSQVKAARQRKTGLEEETKRAADSGGGIGAGNQK
ncbi:TonB-dependent receptor [Niastella populi]|uniref:TonB-dependent receptor n=1 Tax=Niastella populi TaxID=550983 RepID=A0A1V9EUK7_9BACT|nr:TonB-dependent receptor [Niastella populi]OQP49838.1 TonB-dependent receptor [Niastella populi]